MPCLSFYEERLTVVEDVGIVMKSFSMFGKLHEDFVSLHQIEEIFINDVVNGVRIMTFVFFFEIQVWETILKVFFKWITILKFFLFCTQQNCLSRNYWPRWNKFPLHIIPFQYIEISGKMLIFIYKSFIEFCESTFF